MSDHTPGPWSVNFGMRPPRIWAAAAPETTICDMPRWDIEHWAEREANARLIAAAPDLLDACRVALGHFTGGMDGDWRDCDPSELLRAALAKVEGK